MEIQIEIGDKWAQTKCYTNLSVDYYGLGDFKRAIEFSEKGLELAKEIGDRASEADSYTNIGVDYLGRNDPTNSLLFSEKGLEVQIEIGDKFGEGKSRQNIGVAYSALGDFIKAIEYYNQSIEIKHKISNREGEAKVYGSKGIAYYYLDDFKRAIESGKKALAISKEIGGLDLQRTIKLILGIFYLQHIPKKAYDYFRESILLGEEIGGNLIRENETIEFYGYISDAYQYMIPLCIKLGKSEEAFEYTERSKSRSLLELLSFTDIRPSVELRKKLGSLLQKEIVYIAKLREVQMRYFKNKAIGDPEIVDNILIELKNIYDKIKGIDPEYVSLRRAKPLPLDEIQKILS